MAEDDEPKEKPLRIKGLEIDSFAWKVMSRPSNSVNPE